MNSFSQLFPQNAKTFKCLDSIVEMESTQEVGKETHSLFFPLRILASVYYHNRNTLT